MSSQWQRFGELLFEENRLMAELEAAALGLTQALVGNEPARINSAERQLIMRDTVRCLTDPLDEVKRSDVRASIEAMVAAVAAYIPGYRLKQQVQVWTVAVDEPVAGHSGVLEPGEYDEVSVFLEVEDAPATLPGYVDMMTSAARVVAERMALGSSMQR